MQDGVIVDRGTHADLINKEEGPYAQMWKRQTESAAEEAAEMSAAASAAEDGAEIVRL